MHAAITQSTCHTYTCLVKLNIWQSSNFHSSSVLESFYFIPSFVGLIAPGATIPPVVEESESSEIVDMLGE